MHLPFQDTIVALATPPGSGALAIVRISGDNAHAALHQLLQKSISLKGLQAGKGMFFRNIYNAAGDLLDEALVSVFEAPHGFTSEDAVEISLHGSNFIVTEVIKALLNTGLVRLATAGEFTQRAYLHGKLNLAQAEAVADLIASQSRAAHRVAMNQMRGNFSGLLNELREKLIHFASLIELELDFGEEDVEFADRKQLLILIEDLKTRIQKLINSFELGNAIKNGVPVAIVGAPNTGKSTLLNQLLGEDRAIVSNIAGTTRDVIEEILVLDGITFRFIDTAGIREHAEEIEALGIARTKEKIKQAHIVLVLADASLGKSSDEGHSSLDVESTKAWVQNWKKQFPEKHFLLLANKLDLHGGFMRSSVDEEIEILQISAKTGEGIHELKTRIVAEIANSIEHAGDVVLANLRHVEALQNTLNYLSKAGESVQHGTSGDLIAMDIRMATQYLGSITGDITNEDLLDNIFSKFCIGK